MGDINSNCHSSNVDTGLGNVTLFLCVFEAKPCHAAQDNTEVIILLCSEC